MEKENLFEGNLKFTFFSYFQESNTWNFNFEEKVSLQSECLWRLLYKGKIKFTSNDHGQSYGHKEPHDLEKEVMKLLQNISLFKIERNLLTGDLFLEFEKGYQFQLLTDSSGFESWSLEINSKQIIGLGQGDIAKFQKRTTKAKKT